MTANGVLLALKATPKASRNEIVGVRNHALIVKVTAAPDKGNANAAIIELIAKSLGVPKSAVELKSGATSRNKVVQLATDIGTVQTWLQTFRLES